MISGTNVQVLQYATTSNASLKIALTQKAVQVDFNVLILNVSQQHMRKLTAVIVTNGLHAQVNSNAPETNAFH